jgi:hypothetical protein
MWRSSSAPLHKCPGHRRPPVTPPYVFTARPQPPPCPAPASAAHSPAAHHRRMPAARVAVAKAAAPGVTGLIHAASSISEIAGVAVTAAVAPGVTGIAVLTGAAAAEPGCIDVVVGSARPWYHCRLCHRICRHLQVQASWNRSTAGAVLPFVVFYSRKRSFS